MDLKKKKLTTFLKKMVNLFLWQYIHKKRIYYCFIIDKDIKSWRARLLAGHYFVISKEKKSLFLLNSRKTYKSLLFFSLRLSFIFLFLFLLLSYVTYLEVRSNYLKNNFPFWLILSFFFCCYICCLYIIIWWARTYKIWYSQWIF